MLIKHLFSFGFFLLFLVISPSTLAFDKLTHRLICQLAFDNLTDHEKATINKQLNVIPEKHKALINRYNNHNSNQPVRFADTCTWADAIKQARFTKTLSKQFSSWHYVNMPRNHHTIQPSDISAHCSQGCVIKAITHHYQAIINQPSSWEQTQALFFLGHWLGDIHQPLHISFASDLGGNKTDINTNIGTRITKGISTKNQCKTLHWFWDSCLLQHAAHNEQQQLDALQQLWHQQLPKNENNSEVFNIQTNVFIWANESFNIVKEAQLGYCAKESKSCVKLKTATMIDDEYITHYLPVIQLQIAKAAKRLNDILKQLVQRDAFI